MFIDGTAIADLLRRTPENQQQSRLAKRYSRCLPSHRSYRLNPRIGDCMGMRKYAAAPRAALALGLFFTPTVSLTIDAIVNTVAPLVSPAIGYLSFMSPAMGQAAELTKKQSEAFSAYNKAVSDFESILGQR